MEFKGLNIDQLGLEVRGRPVGFIGCRVLLLHVDGPRLDCLEGDGGFADLTAGLVEGRRGCRSRSRWRSRSRSGNMRMGKQLGQHPSMDRNGGSMGWRLGSVDIGGQLLLQHPPQLGGWVGRLY